MKHRRWHDHYDPGVPPVMHYPRLTIQDYLFLAANIKPDRTAMWFYGSEYSFRETKLAALSMANALGEMGVKKGDRVGLHLPNCPQYVIAFYAVLSLGSIAVNINPMYTPGELEKVVKMTGVSTLFTLDLLLEAVRALTQAVEVPRIIVTRITDFIKGAKVSTASDLDLPEGWRHFSEVLENSSSPRRPRVLITPQDPAVIVFTGGTTGQPKGAVLTHGNFVATGEGNKAWAQPLISMLDSKEISVLSLMPFFHMGGNINCLQWAVWQQGTMVLIPRFDIDEVIKVLDQFDRITYFPAVPTMLIGLFNHPAVQKMEMDKKLVMVASGGAPMPVELIEQIKDLGVAYSEGWAMTETTGDGTAQPVLGLKKVGSIGLPKIDTDIKLVDLVNGREEVPLGEPGEIILKSPAVMPGYWDNPRETADQIRDGWIHTGDIATMDEDGYFYLVDRKKDMIIAGGYNVYPREIDEVLASHPKVQEGIAVGIPHEYRGETVKAFIVVKPGETLSGEEIMAFCRERLAAYKAPKIVEFRDALPKSAIGKHLRRTLREEESAKSRK
jgi:long-chain acyl-CoA synthetase